MDVTENINRLLDEKYATDEAFADCFTVDVDLKPGQKLSVFIDSDSGMSMEKCQRISRYLESFLDTNGWLGASYTLEVSSPGLSRPLKFPRQYRNNVGRTLAITLRDKSVQTGTVKSADDQQVVLEQKMIERDGKKKKEVTVETPIAYEQIEKAIVKPSF
jgi:ribosome maturation factor RimP